MSESEFKEEIAKLNEILGTFNPGRICWLIPLFLIIPVVIIPLSLSDYAKYIPTVGPILLFVLSIIFIISILVMFKKNYRIHRNLDLIIRQINQKYSVRGVQFQLNHRSRLLSIVINTIEENHLNTSQEILLDNQYDDCYNQSSTFGEPNTVSDYIPLNNIDYDQSDSNQYDPNQYNPQAPFNKYNDDFNRSYERNLNH